MISVVDEHHIAPDSPLIKVGEHTADIDVGVTEYYLIAVVYCPQRDGESARRTLAVPEGNGGDDAEARGALLTTAAFSGFVRSPASSKRRPSAPSSDAGRLRDEQQCSPGEEIEDEDAARRRRLGEADCEARRTARSRRAALIRARAQRKPMAEKAESLGSEAAFAAAAKNEENAAGIGEHHAEREALSRRRSDNSCPP